MIKQIKRLHLPFLIILWVVVQLFCYLHFGVRSSVDTARYLKIAEVLLSGSFPKGSDVWYISYGATIAFFDWIGLAIEWVIAWNLIASFLTLISIYQVSNLLLDDCKKAFLACLLYLLFIKISQWNFILYTDALFTSFCVITIQYFMRLRSKITWLRALLFGLLLMYTVFLRPVGLVFLIAFLMALVSQFWKRKYLIQIGTLLFLLILVMNLVLLDYVGSFMEAYSSAEIIYPDLTLGYKGPSDLFVPSQEYPPLIRISSFVLHNFPFFLKLFFTKIFLFLTGFRPYFSTAHNILLLFFLPTCYIYSIFGWMKVTIFYQRFSLLFIGLQVLMVGLTTVNWDGRFLLPLLPFVFILTANGLVSKIEERFT